MKPIHHPATLLTLALLAALTLLTPPRAHAQINYQGRLTDAAGATLADGQYTITFSLWTAATGGTQLWGPFIADGTVGTGRGPLVDVVGGINPNGGRFNVIIGATDTSGASLTTAMAATASPFLQIQVAPNAPISPRQQIFATPRALRADVIPNVTTSGSNVGVGMGTTAPSHPLHVNGRIAARTTTTTDGYVTSNQGTSGSAGYFEWYKPGPTRIGYLGWSDGGVNNLGLNLENGANFNINGGNVGIGKGAAAPGATLDVNGNIKLGPSGQFFATSGEENLRIVRGTVNANGTIAAGTRFTVALSGGAYQISFTSTFTAFPTITVTLIGSTGLSGYTTWLDSYTTSSCMVKITDSDGGQLGAEPFNFIAIGPR